MAPARACAVVMHSARALPPRPGPPASLFRPRRGGFADHPLSSDHDGGALTSPPSASNHHHESGRGPARIMPAAVEWPDSSRHEGRPWTARQLQSRRGHVCCHDGLGAHRRPAAAARPPDLQVGQRCSLAGETPAARGLERPMSALLAFLRSASPAFCARAGEAITVLPAHLGRACQLSRCDKRAHSFHGTVTVASDRLRLRS